ncbi:hypothetical protein EAJ17_00870 [Akkermansia sp. aa_0143]|nr:hypothetical protein EAJ17_00870 [Akkermansia sp. aa_0143]
MFSSWFPAFVKDENKCRDFESETRHKYYFFIFLRKKHPRIVGVKNQAPHLLFIFITFYFSSFLVDTGFKIRVE